MSHPGTPPPAPQRIELVDALRGSALMGILLLHSLEHFDFVLYPKNEPAWLQSLNHLVAEPVSFLFAGKSYAIFALMFGLSFFLLLDRAARRGVNFRWRFLWRLTVLGSIGYLHGLVYCGDILGILAVLGLPLVMLYGLSNRLLGWIAALLLVQLPFLWHLGRLWIDPTHVPALGHAWPYYTEIYQAFEHQGFLEVCRANAVKGEIAKWWWMIDNGRCWQMFGLFVIGLMLGRRRVFEQTESCLRFARWALVIGLPTFALFYLIKRNLGSWLPRGSTREVLSLLNNSYLHLAQMLIWIGGFVLLYHFTRFRTVLRWLIPFGRMSLTCYVAQALFWVPMYYNFGFGLFRHWGVFYSVLGGAAFFVLELLAAHWWLRRFHYGPLEWLWRSATLLSFRTPFRRTSVRSGTEESLGQRELSPAQP
jgi:uncharacterized protein